MTFLKIGQNYWVFCKQKAPWRCLKVSSSCSLRPGHFGIRGRRHFRLRFRISFELWQWQWFWVAGLRKEGMTYAWTFRSVLKSPGHNTLAMWLQLFIPPLRKWWPEDTSFRKSLHVIIENFDDHLRVEYWYFLTAGGQYWGTNWGDHRTDDVEIHRKGADR